MSRQCLPLLVGASLLVSLFTACDQGTGPSHPGINIRRATFRDTVGAIHAFDVVVNDQASRPARFVEVRLEMVQAHPNVYVMRIGDSIPTFTVVDTTDFMGALSLRTQHGFTVGQGQLAITVPSLGYVDTISFTVDHGHPIAVSVAPADTALYTSRQFPLRPYGTDRFSNVIAGMPFEFTVVDGPVTVNTAGAVSTTSIGRGAVAVRSGDLRVTAYVSVVPEAWVATQKFYAGNGGPEGIFLMQLDGSGRDSLTRGLNNSFIPHGFGWSPDGQQLVLPREKTLYLLHPGGLETPLVSMSVEINTAARFSRDGQWVYFALGSGRGFYRVRSDGTGLEHIRGDSANWGDDYFVQPSHDGLSVAYTSTREFCFSDPCIRVMDLASTRDRVYGNQDYLVRGSMAAWSPVEDLIAYNVGREVRLVKSDGTLDRLLAADAGQVKWMDWSPDGRWLIVAADFGVALFDIRTQLRLPIAQLTSYSATIWRP